MFLPAWSMSAPLFVCARAGLLSTQLWLHIPFLPGSVGVMPSAARPCGLCEGVILVRAPASCVAQASCLEVSRELIIGIGLWAHSVAELHQAIALYAVQAWFSGWCLRGLGQQPSFSAMTCPANLFG